MKGSDILFLQIKICQVEENPKIWRKRATHRQKLFKLFTRVFEYSLYVAPYRTKSLAQCANNLFQLTSVIKLAPAVSVKKLRKCHVCLLSFLCTDPRNCKHIQERGIKQDGEYDIFLMWPDDKRKAKIYCSDMTSKTPLEYVTLPAGTANNFARHYQQQTHRKEETSFNKV